MKFPGPSEYLGMSYSSLLGLIYYFYTGRFDWITQEDSEFILTLFDFFQLDKEDKDSNLFFIASKLFFINSNF